ncbi:TetR/AcrR family transcriptional regulator [Streptomyces sviceus]|uniref:TetR/AcrR family transcriptional regulator n=1 Tax=Streptomyces sviceus TaxID=285530 RepID=UPI00331B3A63
MPDIKHFSPDTALESVLRLFWRQGFATTGIQDIVTTTGLNRSSLYATFGGKQELYRAALGRYLERRSRPSFRRLVEKDRGLPAVAKFFEKLVEARCAGEFAHWGCLISNAHAGAETSDPQVRALLDRHHVELRDALQTALVAAQEQGQLAAGVDPSASAEMLALLAYGVNLRSRGGADASALRATVRATLQTLNDRPCV